MLRVGRRPVLRSASDRIGSVAISKVRSSEGQPKCTLPMDAGTSVMPRPGAVQSGTMLTISVSSRRAAQRRDIDHLARRQRMALVQRLQHGLAPQQFHLDVGLARQSPRSNTTT